MHAQVTGNDFYKRITTEILDYVAREMTDPSGGFYSSHNLKESKVERKLNEARQRLFNAREHRVKPARDEKILTGWNGLMLAVFAKAAWC